MATDRLSRGRAAELGRETLRILDAGRYKAGSGATVEIGGAVRRAVAGTASYPPQCPVPEAGPGKHDTNVTVVNVTTLAAARRLVEEGHRPAALNFASAKHAGGGFLTGARAQEESLARSSALYACLAGNAMYDLHGRRPDPMYTSYSIYSPDVPVFRAADGTLLDEPYACSFITCPAVNAKVVLERDPSRRPQVRQAMGQRVLKVLAIAAEHGHDALVLGAWGCGVFGNDPTEIAGLFKEALESSWRGRFARVVFAVLDSSEGGRFIRPFEEAFGGDGA
jgi:uncharacterized protein (TIGR02452 family)